MKLTYSRSWLKYALLLAFTGITTVTYTSQNGPAAGNAGAPSENNCTGCHSGSPISSGTSYESITLSGIPAAGYIPGNTYTLTLSGNSAATSKNGYQLIPLTAANAMAGSLVAGTGSQTMTTGSKTYIGHTSSGTAQSAWSFSWTAPSVASGTITFYCAYNATNSSNSSSGDAVYLKTFSFGVGNLPVATITSPANNTVVCLGDSVQFTGSATQNPTSYAWDFLGNVPQSSALQNPKVPMTTAGFKTIRFRATNASGTSANATITIQVVAKPTAGITPSGAQTICGNDSVTLTATQGNGLTYLWTPGNHTTSSIKVGSAGSYQVKITNSNGCFANSNIVTTTVAPKPTVTAQVSSSNICSNDSIILTATPGLSYYRYYINNTAVDSGTSNTKIYKLNGGSYTLRVRGISGACSNIDSALVQVQNKPAAPATNCGTSTVNSVTFLVSGNNAEISLDTMKTWTALNGTNQHTLTGLSANQSVLAFTRTSTSAPCNYSYISSKSCVAAACTPIHYAVTAPAHVCLARPDGSSGSAPVLIQVNGANATLPLYKFGNSAYGIADSFIMLAQAGLNNIIISVKDSAFPNCPSHDTTLTIVGVSNMLAQGLSLNTTPVPVCSNGSIAFAPTGINQAIVQIRYYGSNDSLPFAIRSRSAGFGLSMAPVQTYGLQKGDGVRLLAYDSLFNCLHVTPLQSISWVDPIKPLWSYTLSGLNIDVKDSTPGNTRRTWNFGDGNSVADAPRNQSHTYAASGSYYVGLISTDTNACVYADSAAIHPVPLGVTAIHNVETFKIYPNPASDKIVLEASNLSTLNFVLIDSQGRIALSGEGKSGEEISLQGIASGLYIIQIDTGQEQARMKLFIK